MSIDLYSILTTDIRIQRTEDAHEIVILTAGHEQFEIKIKLDSFLSAKIQTEDASPVVRKADGGITRLKREYDATITLTGRIRLDDDGFLMSWKHKKEDHVQEAVADRPMGE